MRKFLTLLYLCLFLSTTTSTSALSRTYDISDAEAVNGDIITYQDGEFRRASEPFSKDLFGVLEEDSLLVQQTGTGQPITTSGVAHVNVASSNGAIKTGDYITSSTTPGKGQLASKDGFVLGKALANLDGESGQIPVEVQIINTSDSTNKANLTSGAGAVLNTIDALLQKNLQTKEGSFKFIQYVLAAIVFIASITFAFFNFSRSIPKGIEAIGRNPLAKHSIQASIALNAFLSILITLAGVTATIVILRL